MSKNFYYVTVCKNGGVITAAYENAALFGQYMCGQVAIEKFPDFWSAEGFLLEYLDEVGPIGYPLPSYCRLNEMITIRKLLNPEYVEE